jgi:hypothetical protein
MALSKTESIEILKEFTVELRWFQPTFRATEVKMTASSTTSNLNLKITNASQQPKTTWMADP